METQGTICNSKERRNGQIYIKNSYRWTKNRTPCNSNTNLLHVPKWIYTQCTNHITSSICKSLDITDYLVLKKVNRHDVIGIELISCLWGKVLLG